MSKDNGIDSKFRFVILASKRAKQLLHGDKPRIKTKSRNPIRIAQEEVRMGTVGYDIVEPKAEEMHEPEDNGFIGEVIGGEEEAEEESRAKAKKKIKKEKAKPGSNEKEELQLEKEEKEEEEEEEEEKEEKEEEEEPEEYYEESEEDEDAEKEE